MNNVFSLKQYKWLLMAVETMAHMVEMADRYGAKNKTFQKFRKETLKISDYVFSFVGDYGMSELKDRTPQYKKMEEAVRKHIYDFNMATFPDVLRVVLMHRDALEKYGRAYYKMPPKKRVAIEMAFLERYDKELKKNGIKNLGFSTLQ